MRLKLSLSESIVGPVELSQQATYSWSIVENGSESNLACSNLNLNENCQLTLADVTGADLYWQPKDWSLDLNAVGTIKITYPEASQYPEQTIKFKIANRAIGPEMEEAEGSDIKMLEQMLWQLGISPQFSDKGKDGARIGSDRGGNAGQTKSCSGGSTSDRSVFYSGWAGCPEKSVSTEGMIRRFQGRSFDLNNLKGLTTSGNVDGTLNTATLSQLGNVWSHYSQAANGPEGRYTTTNLTADNWDVAINMLTTGGTIPYVDNTSYSIGASYTENEHTNVLNNFPEDANTLTIEGVIKAWVQQESDNIHWGGGSYQRTDYRMYEGAGDEQGSMGFNHIVWKRLYGPENACNDIRGYIGDASNVNMYEPVNSLYGLIVAGSQTNCLYANGLYQAFAQAGDNSYRDDIPEGQRPVAYCYETLESNSNCIANDNVRHAFTATVDDGIYLLGKALVGYNAGTGRPSTHYFGSRLLLSSRETTSDGNSYLPTMFGYWMSIKNKTQNDTQPGYIPYMNFLWASNQNGLDVDGDNIIGDNPATPDIIEGVIDGVSETEIPWCYSYGEKDWMSPNIISEPGRADRDAVKDDYKIDAEDDMNLRLGCI